MSLIPEGNGQYKVMFRDENLGSYMNAAQAADDVAGGYTHSPGDGIDFGQLGIPDDLGEWDKKPFAQIARLRPG
ncbi:MAG: hypothetical protein JJ959_05410 [Nisaea sp.]|nr:hypothetical protein [Nisaea sp.]